MILLFSCAVVRAMVVARARYDRVDFVNYYFIDTISNGER